MGVLDIVDIVQEVSAQIPLAELMPFSGSITERTPATALPYSFADYLELVDWTGRAVRDDKRGYIPVNLPPIVQRLGVEPSQWIKAATGVERHFCHAIGPAAALERFCKRLQKRWLHGTRACRALYPPATA